VEADDGKRVVSLIRSGEKITSPDHVDASFREMQAALESFDLDGWGLLIDMRGARPSQDPAIENAFRENRKRFKEPFARLSILLKSMAGVLQVQRMMQKAPDDTVRVFNEHDEAMSWAAEGA
jgi:hypothetical protein